MADIHCQMCGKPNPDDLVECKYCGARLKPLIAPAAPDDDSGAGWTDASQEDTLGWLRTLGQDDETQETPLDDTDDLPDWVGSPPSQDEPSGFDWMDDVRDEALKDSKVLDGEDEEEWETLSSEDSLTDTFTLPDWGEQSQGSTPEDQLFEDRTNIPDPLQREEKPESLKYDSDLPSWLTGEEAHTYEPKTQPVTDYPSDSDLDSDIPDWLDSLSSDSSSHKLGEMPEWLGENEQSSTEEGQADEEHMDWLATLGDAPGNELRSEDWKVGDEGPLGSVGAIGGLTLDPEDSFISDFEEGGTPDWLESLQGSEVDYFESSDESPEMESSSWDVDKTPESEGWQGVEQPQQVLPHTLSVEDSDVSGDLPSWVQAFRPVDGADIATEYTQGEIERAGPLAGLRGLLTPEASIDKTAKPPAYSASLQVSSSQQTNAQLLQSLIETESIPQALPDMSPLTSQRILRVVVGVILILVMLFPLVSGTQIIPLPTSPLSPEIQSIWSLTNSTPLDRPVLVSMDFDPGMSGELEVAAAAVFDQLMGRGAPLAIVSTSPLGTGLGERQVAYLQSKFPYDHHYVYGEDYVNLGYIAGGTAGLANFAVTPRQSIVMAYDSRPIWDLFDSDAGNPWLSPVMNRISSLKDFPMTIILTDDPDIARNWVEQVAPYLQNNSLTMIVSAQVEPFVRPYFDNPDPAKRQLEGLLVGLRGGAAYEQANNKPFLGRWYWDAFGVGILVAVILILAGGGYNYLDQLNHQRKQSGKGKPRN